MNKKSTWASVLRQGRGALLGVAVAVISASALAIPITYTFTGTGTGTVGATAFTDAAYTITLTGDTSAVGGDTETQSRRGHDDDRGYRHGDDHR